MTSCKKRSCMATIDRIDTLPDNVLSRIMGCLPLRDAARLNVVSRRWRYTWLSLPVLTFDAKFFSAVLKFPHMVLWEVYYILSSILLNHVGPITKFYLDLPAVSASRCFLAPCISCLSRNNVKEITIQNGNPKRLKLGSHIFSCLELEMLKLSYCSFYLPPSFKGLKNLMNLELENVSFKRNLLNDIVACCPKLESLTLNKCTDLKCINITAPKLQNLTVSGKFESLCLQDSQELKSISISLEAMVNIFSSTSSKELFRWLPKLKNLEKLCFKGYFCKLLAAGQIVGILPTEFKCVKVLQLYNIDSNVFSEFHCLRSIIQSCPNVEHLKISFSSIHPAELDSNYDTCGISLVHLHTAQVCSVRGVNMELKLIQFLLLRSPALEELYIERISKIRKDLESSMTRQLMRFRRASPKAEVILC